MSSNRSLVRSAGLIGFATFLSRILGMIRDILTAKIFGTSWVYDAFLMAFMVPNLLKRLLGEGALSSSFIPVFTQYRQRSTPEELWRFASVVGTLVTLLCLVLMGAGWGILTFLTVLPLDPKVALMVDLLRYFLPFLLLVAWTAWAMGILNSFHRFWTPALAPAFLNIGWILAPIWICYWLGTDLKTQIYGLVGGILIGGLMQVVIQIPSLWKLRPRLEWRIDFRHQGVREVGRLLAPSLFGLAVTQLSMTVDLYLGYFLGEGATSSLWYANRLMQFPLGIFAAAMGTAVLPTFSSQAAQERMDQFRDTLGFSLRVLAFIVIPSSVGLIFLREPIVRLLFERNQFTAASTARVANVLMYYALGLLAYSGIKVVTSAFYSLKDTRTPVKVGAVGFTLNLVLNLILMWPMKESGIALATAISSFVNLTVLLVLLLRRIGALDMTELFNSLWRVIAASILMGIGCLWVWSLCGSYSLWVQVVVPILCSVIFFLAASFFLRIPETARVLKLFRGDHRRSPLQ
ncbi:MAG: murein biosynthesis integral membrane protein MurJ [Candidatus Omnitrophica bacterium]|nr:murein biosynthesis integral membrane protein MurJ [Candidatus Omnitrophota bacterium]